MMDAASEAKLTFVNPQLARKVESLAEMMELAGNPIKVMTAFRSWGEQQKLWLQGRDSQGNVTNAGLVVTHAPPGHSWHEYGLGVDCAPISLLEVKNWAPDSPLWPEMGAKGESLGLTWGGRWHTPDRPHFQLTGCFPVSPNDEVRQIFLAAGMDEVWKEAGLFEVST
jgi:peptidoglycan L-alanyl-D-glutamate endopeptidase CwlK